MSTDREIFDALPQAERDDLGFSQWRALQTVSTHSDGCWQSGYRHYNCALNEIARLNAESHALQDGWTPEEISYLAARGFLACECRVCGCSAASQAQPAEPDNLTIAYMSGFADGKKAAQPIQPAAINGWKLVPNCLTPAMRCELLNASGLATTDLYTMLLAAAPCPPIAQPVQPTHTSKLDGGARSDQSS